MNIFLWISSIVNLILIVIFGGGLYFGLGMMGLSHEGTRSILLLILGAFILFLIIPWGLYLGGKKLSGITKTIVHWVTILLCISPLILSVIWFNNMPSSTDTPIQRPSFEEIVTDNKQDE